MKVGYIGLGTMGHGMADNILAKNRQLMVSDVIQSVKDEFAAKGAEVAADNAELIKDCDLVFLSLPNLKVVEIVFNEVLTNAKPGTYVLDTSTIGYSMYKDYAAKAEEKGIHYIDCPISGGKAKSDTGELSIMLGMTKEEAESTGLFEVVQMMAKDVHCAGARGAGMALKIINNMLSKNILFADAEAIVLAEHAGIPFETLYEVVSTSSSENRILGIKMEHIRDHEYGKSNKSYAPITMAIKDLKTARDLSADLNLGNFFANQTLQWYEMGMQRGYEEMDSSSIVELMRELQPVKK